MARKMKIQSRLLNVGISTSKSLAAVSFKAEHLFLMMLPHCDDQGRITGDPETLRSLVCPRRKEMRACDIGPCIDELATNGGGEVLDGKSIVIRYQVDGEPVLQVRNWWKYQAAMRWCYPSEYPPPQGWDQDRVLVRRKGGKEADELGKTGDSDHEKGGDSQVPTSSDNGGTCRTCSGGTELNGTEKNILEEVVVVEEPAEQPADQVGEAAAAEGWTEIGKGAVPDPPGFRECLIALRAIRTTSIPTQDRSDIRRLVTEWPPAKVREAITIAGRQGKPTIAYIEGTLKGHGNGNGNGKLTKSRPVAADADTIDIGDHFSHLDARADRGGEVRSA